MFTAYGLRIRKKHDVLKPTLRERKVVIPSRSGAYDFGANTYDERSLFVECDTIRQLTADNRRELSYLLSEKGKICFWDEPERYYLGRIYDAAEVERVGGVGTYFPLTFICDPFAYNVEPELVVLATTRDRAPVKIFYNGTAKAPAKIIINNGPRSSVATVQIAIKREV